MSDLVHTALQQSAAAAGRQDVGWAAGVPTELGTTCRMPWHIPIGNDSGSSAACVDGGDRRPTCVDDRDDRAPEAGPGSYLAVANGLRFQDVTWPAHLMRLFVSGGASKDLPSPPPPCRDAPCSWRDPVSRLDLSHAAYPTSNPAHAAPRSFLALIRWLMLTDRCSQASMLLWIVSWLEPRAWVWWSLSTRLSSEAIDDCPCSCHVHTWSCKGGGAPGGYIRWLTAETGPQRPYLTVAPCWVWPGLSRAPTGDNPEKFQAAPRQVALRTKRLLRCLTVRARETCWRHDRFQSCPA